jgi:hypothetical protein
MQFRISILTLALCALAGAAAAQTAQTQPAPQSSPGAATPSPMTSPSSPMSSASTPMPSRTESADMAYRQLDANNKGYLTKGDVMGISGFNFDQADTNHDGRLSRDEFAKAWNAKPQ